MANATDAHKEENNHDDATTQADDRWQMVVRNTFYEMAPAQQQERASRATSAPPCSRRRGSKCKVATKEGFDPEETRTTVVIRGVPHSLSRAQLMEVLDKEGFSAKYNFVYLPIEFTRGTNFGYAFVDFLDAQWAQHSMIYFKDFDNWGVPHKAQSNVAWSVLQNLENHVERYRNSPVMHPDVADECKPVMLSNGVRVPFPAPTAPIPLIRRLRTQRGPVKTLQWNTSGTGKPSLNHAGATKDAVIQKSAVRRMLNGPTMHQVEQAECVRRNRRSTTWAAGEQSQAKPLVEQAVRNLARPKIPASPASTVCPSENCASSSEGSTPRHLGEDYAVAFEPFRAPMPPPMPPGCFGRNVMSKGFQDPYPNNILQLFSTSPTAHVRIMPR